MGPQEDEAVDLLGRIDMAFGCPKPDRHGERWPRCPFHGDRRPGSFSYSERGYKCFACGAAGSLRRLAEHLDLLGKAADEVPIIPTRLRPAIPRRTYQWRDDPDYWRRYLPPPPIAIDYYHRRGFDDHAIARWRLGYGVLPASRCRYPRAILPVFSAGRLVALRARAILPEDTDDKWLCAGGSSTVLFGLDELRSDRIVIVTEAPYSAILAMQAYPWISAVAPTVSSVWRDDWTAAIAKARPKAVVVWYDNDQHGETYGLKVAQALARARLPVHRYRWAKGQPEKADLADVVSAALKHRGIVA